MTKYKLDIRPRLNSNINSPKSYEVVRVSGDKTFVVPCGTISYSETEKAWVFYEAHPLPPMAHLNDIDYGKLKNYLINLNKPKKIAKPVDISKQEMTQEAVDKIVNDFSSLLRNDTYKVYAWEEMSHQSLRFLVEYAGKVMGYQD